jgi:hypothetical protein
MQIGSKRISLSGSRLASFRSTDSNDEPFLLEVYGSTQRSPPADTDNSRVLLMSFTNISGAFNVPQGYRWIKARVTGWASGTIYAGMVASG